MIVVVVVVVVLLPLQARNDSSNNSNNDNNNDNRSNNSNCFSDSKPVSFTISYHSTLNTILWRSTATICIYIYICVGCIVECYECVYIYIYIYIERERDIERERYVYVYIYIYVFGVVQSCGYDAMSCAGLARVWNICMWHSPIPHFVPRGTRKSRRRIQEITINPSLTFFWNL